MDLNKTRTSTSAWASPKKQNRPIYFSQGKPTLLLYSLPRSSETRITARQACYTRFQTTFFLIQ
ncbi:hypothetical protein [Neisseria sicca]|uniref:hypothetical protein n=1 Tax=Neisseria sicca TaxID=490 RepID=UPI0011BD07CF|nr:hypothetical protein [Neisseria sicca]